MRFYTYRIIVLVFSFDRFVDGQIGNRCTTDDGQDGECRKSRHCEKASRRFGFGGDCGFGRVVCCPQDENRKLSVGDKSRQKCSELHEIEYQRVSEYGFPGRFRRNSWEIGQYHAIIGGFHAGPYEHPHMAALGFGDETKKHWHCGGTLISELFVLTAAHCLAHRELGDLKWVRLGDLHLESSTDIANPQDFTIARKIPHPKYAPPAQYHDIALIELDRAAVLNAFVKPACLHTHSEIYDRRPSAIGWGVTEFGGDFSPQLQKVFLSFFSQQECQKTYSSIPKSRLPSGIDYDLQICAGGRGPDEKDTCQGDSGGPLQIGNFDLDSTLVHTVAGITSFGKTCGKPNNPGVYTRVSAYIDWIEEIVWPDKKDAS